MAGHCFLWGATRLSKENAQLWCESSEPDRSAGPSPSHDMTSENLECYAETPLPLSSDNQHTLSAQIAGDNKTCPLATATGLQLAQGPCRLRCAWSCQGSSEVGC